MSERIADNGQAGALPSSPPTCQPPVSEPSVSRFSPPPCACDSHLHLFSDPATHPFRSERSYTPPPAPLEMLNGLHKKLGFERAVVVHASAYGDDFSVMVDALRSDPSRFRGVAVVHQNVPSRQIDELHEAGVRGIRINLFQRQGKQVYRGGATFEDVSVLVPKLRQLGWHVQAWLDAEDLPAWSPRLLGLGLEVVIDHMGRITTDRGVHSQGFAHLCELVAAGKVWCKLSGADRISVNGSPFDDAVPYGKALVDANPHRVVWGTDWPHVNYFDASAVPDDGTLEDLIPRYAPDPEHQRLMLVENPARLYGFP